MYWGHYGPQVQEAACVLLPTLGNTVHGKIVFTQDEGFVRVVADVRGLTPGKHGFHVREFGDLRDPAGTSTGGIFNPHKHPHGSPKSARRMAGDLGNLEADENGHARLEYEDYKIQINGPEMIVGRSIVICEREDDFTTQPDGNSGPAVAIGVIGVTKLMENAR